MTNQLQKIEPKPVRIELAMSAADYRVADGISKSELDDFEVCPTFYDATKRGLITREETDAMRFGTLLHGLVLDGKAHYHTKPDGMTFASTAGKAWRDSHFDAPILGKAESDELQRSASALLKHPHVAPLFGKGKSEASMFGVHKETGLLIKGRADWLGEHHIVDIKTTRDAGTAGLSRSISQFRYHVQAAMYLLLAQQNGLNVNDFYFVAIERGEVPMINVRLLTQNAVEFGRAILDRQLRDLKECMDSGVWPDYSGTTEKPGTIDLPKWSYSDDTGMELIGAIPAEQNKEATVGITP